VIMNVLTEVLEGLKITVIGVTVVFVILSILAAIMAGFKPLFYKRAKPAKPMAVVKEEKKPVAEKPGAPMAEKIILPPGLTPEEISVLTAAVLGFLEYKKKKLEGIELFKEFPGLENIIYIAGVSFRAKLKVSVGGVEKPVEVEEVPGGFIVRYRGKEYRVGLKLEK